MGQYHYVMNLDKKQYLHPHHLGDGLKLGEFASGYTSGTMAALGILLACSAGRGSGDVVDREDNPLVGSWAGDRIAIVGDYSEDGDFPYDGSVAELYGHPDFENISEKVKPLVEQMMGIEVMIGGRARRRRHVSTYEVPSQSKPGVTYYVKHDGYDSLSCTCPDHTMRTKSGSMQYCKHMATVVCDIQSGKQPRRVLRPDLLVISK